MLAATIALAAFALVGSMPGPAESPLPVVDSTEVGWGVAAQEEIRPVDVNSATAEDLQKVPGIGEALARRIIEFREEHGPFERIDDLLNVRGIGTASLEKLRPYLAVKKRG